MNLPFHPLVLAVLSAVLLFATACPRRGKLRNSTAVSFSNPIAVGANAWIIRHEGHYYWRLTDTGRCVTIWHSDNLTSPGKRHVIWRAPDTGHTRTKSGVSALHFFNGHWYIHIVASDGSNASHRMIVIESANNDPLSECIFKSELHTGEHIGTKEKTAGLLTRPSSPMTANATLSAPTVVFLVYYAGGFWQAIRKMGLLELIGADPLAPGAWRKHPAAVFAPTAATFGLGHASFAKSPDGRQDGLVYPVKQEIKDGWGRVILRNPSSAPRRFP